MSSSQEIIIYECDHSGHRVDYLSHLIEYVIKNEAYLRSVLFVLGEELISKLKNENCRLDLVNVYQLDNVYIGVKNRNKFLLKSLKVLLIERENVKKVIFLNFDLFIYSFLWNSVFENVSLRAILFRPFVHFPSIDFKDKVKIFCKKLILKFIFFKNRNIEKIFILNDLHATHSLNQIFFKLDESAYKFQTLPDPVKETHFLIENRILGNNSKIDILIIGAIDEKKNVLALMDALYVISSNGCSVNIKLTIAGKIASHFKQLLLEKQKEFICFFEIDMIDKYLESSEFDNFIINSDCIFLAYKGFYSSSGILGHAINNLKPIIFSSDTLVSRIAKEYSVGFGCNPNSVESIASAIIEIFKLLNTNNYSRIYLKNRKKFLFEYSPERFCELLIE